MLVLGNFVRQKKLTTSGSFSPHSPFDIHSHCVTTYDMSDAWVVMVDISFIGFFYVHLVGGQKMIGIIMATRGWTLPVLYLGACLEWFVSFVLFCICFIRC